MLSVIVLNVIMLSVIVLSIIVKSIVMLIVILLSVIMLNVVMQYHYAVPYVEGNWAKWHCSGYHYAECLNA